MQLDYVARTHQGLVRESNQDSILALPELGIFAVADGMGGEQAGDEASAQTIATIRTASEAFFRAAPEEPGQIEALLRETLAQASQDVFQISVREPAKRGLGSTASLLCLHRGLYFIAQVGDSRVYLAREGRVRQLTRDHTLVWMLYEQGAITRAQLETHPERHLLTQCVGSSRPITIDLFKGTLLPGDLFLICSDGLTGYAGEEKIAELLPEERLSVQARAERLIDESLRAGGGDNVSVIIVRVAALGEPAQLWSLGDQEATQPPLPGGPGEEDRGRAFLACRPASAGRGRMVRPGLMLLLGIAVVALVILMLPWLMPTH